MTKLTIKVKPWQLNVIYQDQYFYLKSACSTWLKGFLSVWVNDLLFPCGKALNVSKKGDFTL